MRRPDGAISPSVVIKARTHLWFAKKKQDQMILLFIYANRGD
jgi:hypothetical protein